MNPELEKYEGIYSRPDKFPRYGHSNHGKTALEFIRRFRCESLLDVGCGHNEFVACAREAIPGVRAVGADFSCPSADIRADIMALPFFGRSFDVLTAFDVLEHLQPAQVDAALAECARVAHAFVFSICYKASVNKSLKGEALHPTVKPETWWIERIVAAGAREVHKNGRYLYGVWNGADDVINPCPMKKDATCVLVGNGPSVQRARLGRVIDGFEEIVRFNTFSINGWEKHVGTRTTLWSTFGRGQLPKDETIRPQRALFIHGYNGEPSYPVEELFRVPADHFFRMREHLRSLSARAGDELAKVIPSSGFLVATWLLSHGVERLHLIGFDHFQKALTGQHHYWLRQSFKPPKEHDGDAEGLEFARLAGEGRIRYLI